MNNFVKAKISFLTAFVTLPFLTGIFDRGHDTEYMSLFPEITASTAVEFEENESGCEMVQIVNQKEEVEIRFKIFDWLKSVF